MELDLVCRIHLLFIMICMLAVFHCLYSTEDFHVLINVLHIFAVIDK